MLARTLKFLGLAAIAVGPLAMAQSQAKRVQPIRAGIVILDSAKTSAPGSQPVSAAPHVWFNLQSDRFTKPVSWNIYNPAAPARLSPELRQRWLAIDAGTPALDTPLTKRHAAYWEVFLSQASDATLAQYDVLLVNPANYASVNPQEREKLRKFVDKGGLLWIDPSALPQQKAGQDIINNFPIAFELTNSNLANANERSDFTQPILTSPFPLSSGEISLLNAEADVTVPFARLFLTAVAFGNQDNSAIVGDVRGEFDQFRPVCFVNGNRPTLSIGRIGDGLVVVSSRGASLKLNRPYGANLAANRRFYAMDPIFDQDTTIAAKLAVNMISMLTEFRQPGGGSRKNGSTPIDMSAPLLRRSAVPGQTRVAPTVFKGMVYAVIGSRIVAYDADPYRDLDGNGNPDDGIPDLINGGGEDVVWKSDDLGGTLTSAVCAEVPNKNGMPQDQVIVGHSDGSIRLFDAAPKTAANVFDPNADAVGGLTISPPSGSGSSGISNAPTIHEGLAYVTDYPQANRTRIWVIDLTMGAKAATGGKFWSVGGGGTSPVALPEFSSSSTIGYIPIQDNSGGMDRVLYAPFKWSSSGVPSAGFVSVWLGAKGERPTDYEPKAGQPATSALVVTTRASQQGGLPIYNPTGLVPRRVKLSLLDANGNVMPLQNTPAFGNKGMNSLFENVAPTDLGGGVLSFPFRNGSGTLPPQVAGIRIDYWIDLGTSNESSLAAIERGRMNVPDRGAGTSKREILGPVALSPAGTIWLNAQLVTNDNTGANRGGVYGFREEGRGLFRMVTRWETYEAHSINRNGGDRISYGNVLHDSDPFRLLVYEQTNGAIKFTGALSKYKLVGAPVVRNGQVFVTAKADEGITGVPISGIPSTVLLAFRAEPEVAQVRVGDLPDGSSIIQSDVARSSNLTIPEVPSTLAGANYSYDSRTGIIRFENLSSVQKGVIQNSLSLSQPIIVRRPGRPDEFIEPDTISGSKWNPLLWYTVLQGFDCGNTGMNNLLPYNDGAAVQPNGPFASGDTVYVAGQSLTPSILSGSGFVPQGMIYAFRTDVGQGNPYLVTLDPQAELNSRPAMQKVYPVAPPLRPWLNQFSQFRITVNDTTPAGKSTFEANPGFLWPMLRGTESFDDFIVRLNQTTLWSNGAQSNAARGVVGGDGALIAWGNAGLYTFSRTDFMVADEARVALFDPAGTMTWSIAASGTAGATGTNPTGSVRSLVKPTRAYRIGGGQVAVVDTGANRLALFDSSGSEFRSIEGFRLDKAYFPTGYQQNESLALNAPRDVLVWTSFEQPGRANPATLSRGDGANINAREYWVHYLIADSGNNRLIEIVDRYTYNVNTGAVGGVVHVTPNVGADPVPQLGVLLWHSPANVSGKQFAYNSVNRVWIPDPSDTVNFGHNVFVAGIGGGLPTRTGTGLDPTGGGTGLTEARDGNSGVVIFDPKAPASGMRVFNKLSLPAFDANVFYKEPNQGFVSDARTASEKLLTNVGSVTARLLPNTTNPAIAIMITDGTGVYEAVYNGATSDTLPVQWMLPNEAYRVIRRNPATNVPSNKNAELRATFARRLDSGDVLIVNGYYGPRIIRSGVPDRTPIGGEILEVDGTLNAAGTVSALNMGFNSRSIRFELPPIDGSRGLVIPVYADRR